MKKIKYYIIWILLVGVAFGSLFTSAYTSSGLKQGLRTLDILMQQKFSPKEQIKRYSTIEKVLSITLNTKTGVTYNNFKLIIAWLQDKIKRLEESSEGSDQVDTIEDEGNILGIDYTQNSNITNVDIQRVREYWLDLHNKERLKLGKSAYTLNTKLNYTAYIWAEHMGDIKSWTHKRKPTDGYYNYDSIKNWFYSQGIGFLGKGTLYSESLGYNIFTCKKLDCTQELMQAIKKTFDFYMNEQSWNGPHYRAIIHDNFSTIGMGVAVRGNTYYIVTHYAIEVK